MTSAGSCSSFLSCWVAADWRCCWTSGAHSSLWFPDSLWRQSQPSSMLVAYQVVTVLLCSIFWSANLSPTILTSSNPFPSSAASWRLSVRLLSWARLHSSSLFLSLALRCFSFRFLSLAAYLWSFTLFLFWAPHLSSSIEALSLASRLGSFIRSLFLAV